MKNIDIIAKTATTTAAATAAKGVKIMTTAAPIAFVITAGVNKVTSGAFDAKSAALSVAKAAVTAIAITTVVNTAVATAAVTIGAAKAKSEEDGDVLVEEFDDWDDDEEREEV